MATISGPGRGQAARLLEQGVALAEDPLDVAAQGVVPGRDGHEEVVEVVPAPLRSPLDQAEVVGGEHGDVQHPEQVTDPPQRLAVDLDPVPAGRTDLGLDEQVTAVPFGLGPHHRLLRPDPDEGVGRRSPERPQRGQVPDGLKQVGLALPVAAHDHRQAGRRRDQLGRGVVAEVGEPQVGEVHATRTGVTGSGRGGRAVGPPAPAQPGGTRQETLTGMSRYR